MSETPTDTANPTLILGVNDANHVGLTIQHICQLLDIPAGTWRGWVSKGWAPNSDGGSARQPYWLLPTIINYVRNAPGGRLGYPVG